jgi:hypothetical protein
MPLRYASAHLYIQLYIYMPVVLLQILDSSVDIDNSHNSFASLDREPVSHNV